MKKLIIIFLIAFLFTPASFASDNYIAYANKTSVAKQTQNLTKEIKQTLKTQISYTNSYNLEKLKEYYSNNYMNSDGFDKKTYFELVKKTWDMYPDIKYSIDITDICIVGNTAVVKVQEIANATTTEKVGEIDIKGYLKSTSDSIYYMEKIGDRWIVNSDSIISECTTLTYGEGNDVKMELVVPQVVPANTEYTASLNVTVPDKKMLVIASIGQEQITYPQVNSEEVFRKLPEDGILERIFRANKDNFNEYTVGSIGITRAKVLQNKEVKLLVTGLGYIITRTNVISAKDFSKVKNNGKKETTKSME